MSDRSGHICPECGTPREPGGSPACGCARRAADELLETRTAEAAAAEDFDPLRIRPYVDLGVRDNSADAASPGTSTEPATAEDHPGPGSRSVAATAPTGTASERPPGVGGLAGHGSTGGTGSPYTGAPASYGTDGSAPYGTGGHPGPQGHAGPDDRETLATPMPSAGHTGLHGPPDLRDSQGSQEHQSPLDAFGASGTPGAHPADAFADTDATSRLPRLAALPHPVGTHLFDTRPPGPDAAPAPAAADFPDDSAEVPSRRRRFALVGAGATAVVVAAAGFASGLFSYESPSRDSAAPDDIRASVPDASVEERSPSASASPSPSPSASPSASPSPSVTPSATRPAAPPTPSRAASTSSTPSADSPTGTTQPPSGPPEKGVQPVLRRGDTGPEVTELQLRLQQLALFVGNSDGDYDNRTENAVRNYQVTRGINEEPGVYAEETRNRLETETSEP
ncbi:peptidoglycan-binding protein [Streptomyces sp. NPDC001815]|uniref:peptidoglycan-binding domain-containing protein n=1 Tax=Streptomyces sp. NPDC001815 TaxID=3154526 RepID=UPI0033324FC2